MLTIACKAFSCFPATVQARNFWTLLDNHRPWEDFNGYSHGLIDNAGGVAGGPFLSRRRRTKNLQTQISCEGFAMIAAPMSWTHELEKYIPSGSLNNGRHYFRSGAVEIVKGSATNVVARVKAGGAYDVKIRLASEEDTVVVRCTCPHYEGLHIWATLLKAESAGYLTKIPEISEPHIETELEREPEDDD